MSSAVINSIQSVGLLRNRVFFPEKSSHSGSNARTIRSALGSKEPSPPAPPPDSGHPLHHRCPLLLSAFCRGFLFGKHIILQTVNHILIIRTGSSFQRCPHLPLRLWLWRRPHHSPRLWLWLLRRPRLPPALSRSPSEAVPPDRSEESGTHSGRRTKLHNLKRRADKLDKRMKQNVSCLVDKNGIPYCAKVSEHSWHTAAHLRSQPQNPGSGSPLSGPGAQSPLRQRKLLARVLYAGDADVINRLWPLPVHRTEQILFHEKQARRIFIAPVLSGSMITGESTSHPASAAILSSVCTVSLLMEKSSCTPLLW